MNVGKNLIRPGDVAMLFSIQATDTCEGALKRGGSRSDKLLMESEKCMSNIVIFTTGIRTCEPKDMGP